ncbi:hypothetical protein P4O66_018441, partial [Electrophorus voltai]
IFHDLMECLKHEVSHNRKRVAVYMLSVLVSNNKYVASLGGLVTLSDSLASLVPHCKDDIVACKLATTITRTLSACIADNKALAPVLSKLWLVQHFLLLLSVPNLSPQDQLVVVMTLGHCTSACGDFVDILEHQSQLLLGGGLSLMISLLTETNDEVTFVLQTCKNPWSHWAEMYRVRIRTVPCKDIGSQHVKYYRGFSTWKNDSWFVSRCVGFSGGGVSKRCRKFPIGTHSQFRDRLRDFGKSLNAGKREREHQQSKNGRVGSENNT